VGTCGNYVLILPRVARSYHRIIYTITEVVNGRRQRDYMYTACVLYGVCVCMLVCVSLFGVTVRVHSKRVCVCVCVCVYVCAINITTEMEHLGKDDNSLHFQ